MSTYLIYVCAAAAAAFALYAGLYLARRDRRGAGCALLSLPLCCVLGFVFAKVFYVLLMKGGDILQWGEWDAFLNMKPKTFSFVGGAVGVWLGVRLGARITGKRPAGEALDTFVLPGTLLIAGLRLAEVELGTLGTGRFIEVPEGASCLILAVFNQYGEPHVAVFVWEALAALVVGGLSLLRTEGMPGQRFRTAVFRLCACQILLENMRSANMKWGFVCVEQVLCAVIMMILTVLACLRTPGVGGWRRFLPAIFLFLCFGAIVGTEFLRQRSPSQFMGEHGGYLIMGAILAGTLLIYRRSRQGAGVSAGASSGDSAGVSAGASGSSGKESSKGM